MVKKDEKLDDKKDLVNKDEKLDDKKNLVKKERKEKKVKEKKESFLHSVRMELKKVQWPELKNVFKYTVATIIFCILLAGFFSLLNLGLSFIKGMFI